MWAKAADIEGAGTEDRKRREGKVGKGLVLGSWLRRVLCIEGDVYRFPSLSLPSPYRCRRFTFPFFGLSLPLGLTFSLSLGSYLFPFPSLCLSLFLGLSFPLSLSFFPGPLQAVGRRRATMSETRQNGWGEEGAGGCCHKSQNSVQHVEYN